MSDEHRQHRPGMSERPDFDLREQIARIDRARLESDKFAAEQRKLSAEAEKLLRETRWFPWLQLTTTLVAAIAAIVAAVAALLLHR